MTASAFSRCSLLPVFQTWPKASIRPTAGLADLAEGLPVDPARGLLPRGVRPLVGGGAPVLGEREQLLAALARTGDQPLVLQQLERGVDRAGAGLPGAAAAFGDLLDHLVAVHRAVLEQGQDRGPYVTAPRASPRAAAAAVSPGSGSTGAEPRPTRTERAEGGPSPLESPEAPQSGALVPGAVLESVRVHGDHSVHR